MFGDVLGLAHVFVVFLWCLGGSGGVLVVSKMLNWPQRRCEILLLGLYARLIVGETHRFFL